MTRKGKRRSLQDASRHASPGACDAQKGIATPVSNVIRFPAAASHASKVVADPYVGTALHEEPVVHSHVVQFYETEAFLYDAVGRFLAAGLRAGDRIVVIAAEAHREGFARRLDGLDFAEAVDSGRLVMLDARATLAKFMVDDTPDPDLFRDVISRVIAEVRGGEPGARVRAYGEMVDLLWRDGNAHAALRLEELWNEAGRGHEFSLLCAYVMGNFYREGDAERFMEVCRNHSHVIPTEGFTQLDDTHARLREISFLQQRARSLESEITHRKELEGALRDALVERTRVEDELRASLRREREARARAEANDAFKEMFLGILGHDLRNPLSTILTTARLMAMRGELGPDSAKRINRIVVSGVRMQRMIEQLLDVTRARLTDGIPVDRADEHDLVAIVAKIADELRGAHPGRRIELSAGGPCLAHLDPDRIEQVVSNLLGNAVTHGDPERPITASVATRGEMVSVRVHNHGRPIEAANIPMLFDPWRRGETEGRDGLGLGLYIAERIISAHGGTIEVESSEIGGTRFEVIFPRSPW